MTQHPQSAQEEIESLARFPSENPYPVLRIADDGTMLYANAGSAPLLAQWRCAQGEKVPAEWRERVREALRKRAGSEIQERFGDSVYAIALSPIAEAGYVTVYGSDITKRVQAEAAL